MAERNLRVKVGGFVVVMLAAFTVLILMFGGTPRFLANTEKYTVVFSEAPGVIPGTPVRKSGVRIGRVVGLEIDDDTGKVRVQIEVDRKFLPRVSEEPVIARGLLNGDTNIDFLPKAAKDGVQLVRAERYASEVDIPGVAPVSPAKIITQAQGTIPDAQTAIQEISATFTGLKGIGPKAEKALDEFSLTARTIKEFIPELKETNRRVQAFLGEPDLPGEKPETPATLKQLLKEVQDFVKEYKPLATDVRNLIRNNEKQLTDSLKSIRDLTDRAASLLSDENRKTLADTLKIILDGAKDLLSKQNRDSIAAIIQNVNKASQDVSQAIKSVGNLATNLEKTVNEFTQRLAEAKGIFDNLNRATKPIADNAEPLMKNLTAAAADLSRTLAEVRQTVMLLNKSDGTVSRLLTDPQVYNNIAETTASLTRTLHRAEKIARDFEIFADKIARRPESIGLGGIVRPNTGLKESPFAPLPTLPLSGANPGVVNPGVPAVLPRPSAVMPFPPATSLRGPDAALQPPELPEPKLQPFPPMR